MLIPMAAIDPPDDQNLTCVTRDLSSVQCSWNRGRETHIGGNKGETKYTVNGRYPQYIYYKINPMGCDTASAYHDVQAFTC